MHMVIAKGRSLFDQFKYHGSEYRIRIGHHVRKEDGQVGLQRMTRIFPDVLLFQESGTTQTLLRSLLSIFASLTLARSVLETAQ